MIKDWALGVTAIMDWLLEPVLGSEDSEWSLETIVIGHGGWWSVIGYWLYKLVVGLSEPCITSRPDMRYKKVMLFIAKVCFKIKSPIYQHWVRQESWDSGCTHCGKPPIAQKTLKFTNCCKSAAEYITKCFEKAASWAQTVKSLFSTRPMNLPQRNDWGKNKPMVQAA